MSATCFSASSAFAAAAVLLGLSCPLAAQSTSPSAPPIPNNASRLEGVPTVRVESTPDSTSRRSLDGAPGKDALTISIVDGRYFWTSRGDRPLTLKTTGEFTYLSSTEPGEYIRFRRVNGRLTYVEHVDVGLGSETYWGELRVVLGK